MKNKNALKLLTAAKIIWSALYVLGPLVAWLIARSTPLETDSLLGALVYAVAISAIMLVFLYMILSPGYLCGMAILFSLREKSKGTALGKRLQTSLFCGIIGLIGQLLWFFVLSDSTWAMPALSVSVIAAIAAVISLFLHRYAQKKAQSSSESV